MSFTLRKATLHDIDDLELLIRRSARQLCARDYSNQQIEVALSGAFGVDTQLIQDGSYFVVEDEGNIIACGGWSRRLTLFGGDNHSEHSAEELNPKTDAAKIRAYFVDPRYARRGAGTMILNRCESEADLFGFTCLELMATLSGARLYAKRGYLPKSPIQCELSKGVNISFIPMTKAIVR